MPLPEPTVYSYPAPGAAINGPFAHTPLGVILHGSRSSVNHGENDEFFSTAGYCRDGCPVKDENTGVITYNNYLWHATIGPDKIATHCNLGVWGVSAGDDSALYLAVEFSQPFVDGDISVDQEEAFCWWFIKMARARYPTIPLVFPYHSELAQGISHSKTDAFSRGSTKGVEFRKRIMDRLAAQGVH